LERGLPAKNDSVVCLADRGGWFAGKPRSNGSHFNQNSAVLKQVSFPLERGLPAKNDNAVGLAHRGVRFAGQPPTDCITGYQPRPEFTQKFTDSDVVIDSTW